jgi:hypothetical protein
MNTVNLPRAAVSILKGIDWAIDRHYSHGFAALRFFRPAPMTMVQPSAQLNLTEKYGAKEKSA